MKMKIESSKRRGNNIANIQVKASHISNSLHMFEIVNIIMLGYLLK